MAGRVIYDLSLRRDDMVAFKDRVAFKTIDEAGRHPFVHAAQRHGEELAAERATRTAALLGAVHGRASAP